MMCLCENNQIESWQMQEKTKQNKQIIWLHMVRTIACVMRKQQFFKIETNTQNF